MIKLKELECCSYTESKVCKRVFNKLASISGKVGSQFNRNTLATWNFFISVPIEQVVTHESCIPEVKNAYVNFLNHCYVDTEVEMKEIYSSSHIWKLFDEFMKDMTKVIFILSFQIAKSSRYADTCNQFYLNYIPVGDSLSGM